MSMLNLKNLLLSLALVCIIDLAMGQQQTGRYGGVAALPGEFESYRIKINKLRASIAAKPDYWEARYDEGLLYNQIFNKFIQQAQIDWTFYNRYRLKMDSLRYQMILNGAEWLDLAATVTDSVNRIRQQQQALFQMASGYYLANDHEYELRICEKLDTLGYKFPNWVHGPYFGGAIGSLPTVEIGYHLGFRAYPNKLLGQFGTFSGAQVGFLASPLRGVLGFGIGYSTTFSKHLMLGLQFASVGNSDRRTDVPVDPDNNSPTVVDAYLLRPELGYSRGPFQVFGLLNLAFANGAATPKRSEYAVSAWPLYQFGLRYFFCFRVAGKESSDYRAAVKDYYKE